MEALGRRWGDEVGEVFVEEYLRELWERTPRFVVKEPLSLSSKTPRGLTKPRQVIDLRGRV
jgi:hypothetical protein